VIIITNRERESKNNKNICIIDMYPEDCTYDWRNACKYVFGKETCVYTVPII